MLLVTAATVFLLLGTLCAEELEPLESYECSDDCFAIPGKQDNCFWGMLLKSCDNIMTMCSNDVLLRPVGELTTDWCTKERFDQCYVACNDGDDGKLIVDTEVFDKCRINGGCHPTHNHEFYGFIDWNDFGVDWNDFGDDSNEFF